MADCELIEICIFFNDKMDHYPAATERLKKEYCQGDNSQCARYEVYRALGLKAVPTTLYPGERARAKMIMRYSGPRMLFRHPYLALAHKLDGFRKVGHPGELTREQRARARER